MPVDRDGDRRWASMVMKRRAAEAEGKEFPECRRGDRGISLGES